MQRTLFWKAVFILAVVLVCLLSITGIPHGLGWRAVAASARSRVHLGLDLQGGTHLILQVQVDDAVRAEASQNLQRMQTDLAAKGIGYSSFTQPDPQRQPALLSIQGVPVNQVDAFQKVASDDLGATWQVNAVAPGSFNLSMLPAAITAIKETALDKSIETISNRINQLGVTEPTVQKHGLGQYQILVQLPGITDEQHVMNVMQNTAMLELRLVLGGPYGSEADARAAFNGVLPAQSVIMPGASIGAASTSAAPSNGDQYYVLTGTPVVNGNDLRDAEAAMNTTGGEQVDFTLTRDAGQRFGAWTQANIGKNLAVVLDNRVQESAVIEGRIEDQGRIEGQFTRQQADDLALILRSGALPASITVQDDEVVGPSLGADSIHDGIVASIVGFLLVSFFMLVYYQGAGINAVLALVLNLIILMACLAAMTATLTLPGIAGIILTIGMAVDSNVLIFERIREEMRGGRSVPAAVEKGFRQAFITILDTHVTTFVSASFLFLFGTGPIKGFAVTLTVGLVANLFTAIFVSRAIFDYVLFRQQGTRGAHLSI